jgi:hypothetical protein
MLKDDAIFKKILAQLEITSLNNQHTFIKPLNSKL